MEITIGIVGYGEFGKFIHTLFKAKYASITKCKVYSRSHQIDNKKFYALAEVCKCNFVILCTPIFTFESAVSGIKDLLDPQTILIEVCSVKVYPNKILKKYTDQVKYITTHPMFGPNSFKKDNYDFKGKRIVVTDSNLEKTQINRLITLLKSQQLEVVECTSHEHDELAARTQFLTLLLAQLMKEIKANRTKIDTVSYRKLIEALGMVKANGTLFEQIYRYNPYTKEMLDKINKSLRNISTKLNK